MESNINIQILTNWLKIEPTRFHQKETLTTSSHSEVIQGNFDSFFLYMYPVNRRIYWKAKWIQIHYFLWKKNHLDTYFSPNLWQMSACKMQVTISNRTQDIDMWNQDLYLVLKLLNFRLIFCGSMLFKIEA